jgi:hypothetical protein
LADFAGDGQAPLKAFAGILTIAPGLPKTPSRERQAANAKPQLKPPLKVVLELRLGRP